MKTRNNIVKLLAATVLGAVLAQGSWAATVSFNRINGHFAGVTGGEFTAVNTPFVANYASEATAVNSAGQVGFQTFCLELNEEMRLNTPYDYTVEHAAIEGGVGGPSPDPLSWGSAWLYSEFAAGTLAGYEYTPGANRSASAGELQQAFWWLEEEITLANPGDNTFLAMAIAQFGSEAAARADATPGAFNVWVLNPTQNGVHRQSVMVIRVPDGGLTLGLLGMSLLGIAALRKRLRAHR